MGLVSFLWFVWDNATKSGMGRCYKNRSFCDFGWDFTMNLQVHVVFLMLSTIWRCKFHKIWLGENIIGGYTLCHSTLRIITSHFHWDSCS